MLIFVRLDLIPIVAPVIIFDLVNHKIEFRKIEVMGGIMQLRYIVINHSIIKSFKKTVS